ncbi:MAG: thiamine diphosphokinase [Ruminococcaceae bacterium]|nr:thiamine diphosphokinase [Oscillospiraceae bacterium]
MKAFIYVGGSIYPNNITEHPKADDLCIAADVGADNAKILGDSPDIIVGDFDSSKFDTIKKNFPKAEITVVPAEKDFTDSELAIETAIKKGANEIVIIGGLDGRLDHTLTNISILESLSKSGIYATITDGKNRVRYIENTSTLIPRSYFKYLSLIPRTEKVKGVTILGCKYPLEKANLSKSAQGLTVSNEITENCAFIAVKKGGLLIIESSDIL